MKLSNIAAIVAASFAVCSTASLANQTTALLTSNSIEASQSDVEVITVTANRYQSSLSSSLANQHVITADYIEALNATTVAEVLTTVAGFDLSQTGGRGQNASIFLRGNNASHTLVLLNGVKLTSATLGLADTQKLSVANIERIEIIKGPRASVWGSEAIAGVVNIITKAGGEQDQNGQVIAKVGSNNTTQLAATAFVTHGDGQTTLRLDHEQSDGFDVLDGSYPDEDGYRYNTLSIQGSQPVNKDLSMNWLANFDRGQNDYDSSFGGADQSVHHNSQLQIGAVYQWDNNTTTANVNRFVDDATTYADTPGSESRIITKRQMLELQNVTKFSETVSYFVGADVGNEEVSGGQTFTETERSITGVYAQAQRQDDALLSEISVRYDDVEGIDSEVTYTAAVGYEVSSNSQLSLSVGTGFKAPTFNDLYWPDGLYSKGNPELVSESSENVELSYKHEFEMVSFSASAYRNEVDNLIEWQPDASFVYAPQNIASATLKGLELDATYSVGEWLHTVNASWSDPVNNATGKTLALRAKRHFNYIASGDVTETVSATVRVSYTDQRQQASWDGSVTTLGSFTKVDLNARYQLSDDVSISVGIKDAFDQQEPTAVGYLVEGRSAELSVAYSF